MAFTISRAMNRNGYKISTGDRHPTYAADLREVQNALEHYYTNHPPQLVRSTCPFCRR